MGKITISVDIFVLFFIVLFIYYGILYLFSNYKRTKNLNVDIADLFDKWGFVILIPAHNEALVIKETVKRAKELPGRVKVVVIDDGSTDGTGDLVEPLLNEKTFLLKREYPEAKQGKGKALNYAFGWVKKQLNDWYPDLSSDHVIVTVLDADGYLDSSLLPSITKMFSTDKSLGGVQTPVTIQNAGSSLWLLMQDIEFVGFSNYVQKARHWFSSVGLGGNGQFVTVSALESLGTNPWSDALSEDLDIGVRMLIKGYRLGFCSDGFVHQQGLTNLRALLKQRTRWMQGHYQAWKHIKNLWKSPANFITKFDTTLYLILVISVWIVMLNLLISFFGYVGIIEPRSELFEWLYSVSPLFTKITQLFLSFGIIFFFTSTYKKNTRANMSWYQWPAVIALFYLYSWVWIYATIMAIYRLITGRVDWVKTKREVIVETVNR